MATKKQTTAKKQKAAKAVNKKAGKQDSKQQESPAKQQSTKQQDSKVDKFGSRLGTKAAAVNAALGATPKTMKELMQAVDSEDTFYNHINKLIAAGHVERTDKGYKLK